jgi:hypothetical protein
MCVCVCVYVCMIIVFHIGGEVGQFPKMSGRSSELRFYGVLGLVVHFASGYVVKINTP